MSTGSELLYRLTLFSANTTSLQRRMFPSTAKLSSRESILSCYQSGLSLLVKLVPQLLHSAGGVNQWRLKFKLEHSGQIRTVRKYFQVPNAINAITAKRLPIVVSGKNVNTVNHAAQMTT